MRCHMASHLIYFDALTLVVLITKGNLKVHFIEFRYMEPSDYTFLTVNF